MSKPTTLATQLAKQADEKKIAETKEDRRIADQEAPEGKVWVRLIRPHYDAAGVYHEIGPTLLDADAIPSSAKVLTKREAVEAQKEAEED